MGSPIHIIFCIKLSFMRFPEDTDSSTGNAATTSGVYLDSHHMSKKGFQRNGWNCRQTDSCGNNADTRTHDHGLADLG